MNPNQMAQQLKHALATVEWPGGDVVFGASSVLVYAGTITADQHPPAFPFALVTIGAGTPDRDDPELLEQSFSILTAVEAAGDPMGEHAIIGSARAAAGSSRGAGLAEVAERVRSAVQKLTTYTGGALIVSGSGAGAPSALGNGRHVAFDEFRVQALCTSQPFFTAPQRLRLVGDTWSWRGSPCSDRFDFVQFRLGYVSGDTPAASIDDMEGFVYTGTATEHSAAPVPGRVYHLFADYRSRGAGTFDASSAPELGSYLRT